MIYQHYILSIFFDYYLIFELKVLLNKLNYYFSVRKLINNNLKKKKYASKNNGTYHYPN